MPTYNSIFFAGLQEYRKLAALNSLSRDSLKPAFYFTTLTPNFCTFTAMQQRNDKDKIDIINMLLEDCIMAYPISTFIISVYQQYQRRGWLSKKQLQGVYDKASKINGLPPGRLATLEAIIKRMPTKDNSELPENTPMFEKDAEAGALMEQILEKYPQHKRVLFLKARYDNNEVITPVEVTELNRFKKVLFKDK